jgi:hypothetical protein
MAIEKNELEPIQRRLDLIAHLLCMLIDQKHVPSITDQIGLLSDCGLAPADIGRIVGREANYVSASLKNRKKVIRNAK